MMKTVIITGGIGSGKSEVCRIFAGLGVKAIYNADSRVKTLYCSVSGLLEEIEEALKVNLRTQDGCFCPSSLAKVIFSDTDALRTVEDMVFPYLKEDFNAWIKDFTEEKIVLFESATILEKEEFDGFGDYVIFVDAPAELRKSRAAGRDKCSEERIEERMKHQARMESFYAFQDKVDYLLVNSGTYDELEKKVKELCNKLINN